MGALSFALPFTVLLCLLPSLLNAYNLGKVATTVAEQLNNLVDIIGVSKEIRDDNGEIVDESSNPLIITKSVDSVGDPTKLNVGFQAKVESKNLPLRTEHLTPAKLSFPCRDATAAEGSRRNATVFHLYIPDIKDMLREKFAKANMQLGLDVGVTGEHADKIDALVVDDRSRGKKNYIRLCKRLTDGSTTSLMQKLRGKDCVKLLRNEFYLEPTRDANWRRDDTLRLVGLKIGTKTDNGRDYKDFGNESQQRSEASISDILANYDESPGKVAADKLGTGLNIKMPMIDGRIANLMRDGKLSLSASTMLNV
ncbi:PREDICTED: uncharacterized protein LOC105451948 isoform X2 [Wasmannia auropunctata]|uniref:uncharacterized protein LOC105451948 isoform X2 n=1 Tax=Wasmannia auropunctata TaxID=64793 RepID=UPI0005EE36BA|nr:PREDICTED: uncharacterized protein LOC105451948 isoform X2 [Wasmannia auropunctata]